MNFSWRYPYVMLTDIAEKNYPKLITRRMHPGNMLLQEAQKNQYIEGMDKRRFYSLETSETYEIELPEATRRKCLGVGYRWLLSIGYDLKINLLHPFTRRQIGLPPLLSFANQYNYDEDFKPGEVVSMFVKKAVMSTDPDDDNSNQDCVILAIYGEFRNLAFARPGDEVWTDISVVKGNFEDVLYYKGRFYAINCHGDIFVLDIDDKNSPKISIIASFDGSKDWDNKYLVESSSGSLLMVVRIRSEEGNDEEKKEVNFVDRYLEWKNDTRLKEPCCTKGFEIFRMEEWHEVKRTRKYKLTKVESLGDEALFLGYNASVSVPSSECIKANCIYFSEDQSERYVFAPFGGGSDTGIFDVENKTITPHYAAEFKSHLTPPLWFI